MTGGGWQDRGRCGCCGAEDAMLLMKRMIGGILVPGGSAAVAIANDERVTIRVGRSCGQAAGRNAGKQHLKRDSIGCDHRDPRP
jgi:hypothetical protein